MIVRTSRWFGARSRSSVPGFVLASQVSTVTQSSVSVSTTELYLLHDEDRRCGLKKSSEARTRVAAFEFVPIASSNDDLEDFTWVGTEGQKPLVRRADKDLPHGLRIGPLQSLP